MSKSEEMNFLTLDQIIENGHKNGQIRTISQEDYDDAAETVRAHMEQVNQEFEEQNARSEESAAKTFLNT